MTWTQKILPICLLFFLTTNAFSSQDKPLRVVASFSILGDIVKTIGGDMVEVQSMVGENQDPHIFQPTPQTSILISESEMVFINGLGLEGWFERLIEASGYQGNVYTATRNISAINRDGTEDPHAWHSLQRIKIYAQNIAEDLSRHRPNHAQMFHENVVKFTQWCDETISWVEMALKGIPKAQRTVITAHDAFSYMEKDFDINFEAPQGISTEAEPTAKDVARMIDLARQKKIRTVFVESLTSKRLIAQLAAEAGAEVGATLYTDALSSTKGPAPDYKNLMEYNLKHILEAMQRNTGHIDSTS